MRVKRRILGQILIELMEIKAMVANFEEILNRPASTVEPPKPLPVGTYHCLVDGPPAAEESSQKKTPCRTFKFKILSALKDVDPEQIAMAGGVVGKLIAGQGAGTAFYLTDDSAWRYREFLVDHLGLEEGNKTLRELEAEAPGKQVLVVLKHDLSQDGKRVFHRVDKTAHV